MVKGVGIDLVYIPQIREFMEKPSFVKRTFTSAEQAEGMKRYCPEEYFAGRFAVKEAVFKAIANLTEKKGFDFRIVETMNLADGKPVIIINEKLQDLMNEAGVDELLVSISADQDYATAIVIAQ